jgi:glycosyltransferase involved in cell wall biosynthesis
MSQEKVQVSIVMPCLDEQDTVGICVKKAKEALEKLNINAEVIVVDNGSKDNSVRVALESGARVVYQPQRGYGSAYIKGLSEANGEYIIMGDSDDTYDFSQIDRFLKPLQEGFDFVIGSRLRGKILPGSMPFLHRYLGNPFLSSMLRFLFRANVTDAYCGMRSFTKEAYDRMQIISRGMEFALEMVVKAFLLRLKIKEIPIVYYARKGVSKLSPFLDTWRSIRFMLLFSPNYLFLIPGLFLFLSGAILMALFLPERFSIFGRIWGIHSIILTSLSVIVGLQIIIIGFFAKTYALSEGFIKQDRLLSFLLSKVNLETGLLVGFLFLVAGIVFNIDIFLKWVSANFGPLDEVKTGIAALTLTAIGIQIIFSSFFMGLLNIRRIK